MARVRDILIDEVTDDVKPIYKKFSEEYGPFLNQVKIFAHHPTAVKHIMGLLLELKDEQVLPKRYLEISLVTVSKLNECRYCVGHHTPRLIEQGFNPETVAAILETTVPGFNEVDLLVRDFARQVTENANRMHEEIFERMRVHFSEEQIVELTLRTALCGFFNRFNDALMIDVEEGVIEDMLKQGSSINELPD